MRAIRVEAQGEVASLHGDIGVDKSGAPALHVHVVLGRRDGSARAGHLTSAEVRPTLEVLVTETPSHLRRVKDPESLSFACSLPGGVPRRRRTLILLRRRRPSGRWRRGRPRR